MVMMDCREPLNYENAAIVALHSKRFLHTFGASSW
jgi:hypothetical protein